LPFELPPGQPWPRISLVTAVYNGEHYLEDTIRSILGQGYPNLEYIVVNDGSTDRTRDILRTYEPQLTRVIDQPNRGLYPALNTGFAQCTGDLLGWLNCSDMLHTHGLFVVGAVFSAFPEVEWITGRPTNFNEAGMTVRLMPLARWSRARFLMGANRHIQQESTFWRRRLWERAGGEMSTAYRVEGDFELWVRFFRHARLHSVDALIAGWRNHDDSLSHGDLERYERNCDEIVDRELASTNRDSLIRSFRSFNRLIRQVPGLRGAWQRLVMRGLYRLPGPDWPQWIGYVEGEGWAMHSWRRTDVEGRGRKARQQPVQPR
jgi:glycosyltransferase involved in cell wall biosynthesis